MNNDLIPNLIGACEDISRQVILKSHAIAAKLGLSPSDFEHLNLLIKSGPMTAGGLSDLTGLTTGAVTGVIDRLEKADFVTRQSDQSDRRRIIIVPNEKAVQQVLAINKKSYNDFQRCFSSYTDDEIATILTFLRTTTNFLHQETIRISDIDDKK